ncbi:HigA family addiction module antitoxin [Asaia sp. SF2.1]|uniref:HigA family addiction module antitoxin n=1 Tax=Asaia sp. SF2.1 TaxID=406101 RepID=UPI0003D36D0A|nr:HigA family addiction module antitoxin [Asaia sp. SF2.1]ETC99223.1 XRE family transcriptional regulator [Asaia sp. SF2.1]
MALKMHSSIAVHVGDWIKTELFEPQNIRINTVAEHLGVSRQAISAILNGRCGLTAEMASRFEKVFDIRSETLMRMQSTFDLAQARTHTRNLCIQHFCLPNRSDTEQ